MPDIREATATALTAMAKSPFRRRPAIALLSTFGYQSDRTVDLRSTDPQTKKKIYVDGFSRNKNKRPHVPNHLFFADQQTVDLSDA